MCRLAAWMGPHIALEDVIVTPAHSLIEQSQAATEAKLAVNGDGFGFAWYADNGDLGLYRDILPAWTDGNLLSLSSMIRSRLFWRMSELPPSVRYHEATATLSPRAAGASCTTVKSQALPITVAH